MKPRLMIIGHGRHGKDTVAELFGQIGGFKYISSSWAICEAFIFEKLRVKYNYATIQECFDDRSNHRKEWYDLCREFNTPDKTLTTRLIYEKANIYIGLRDREEFIASREAGLIDLTIWVDASKRLPPEPVESNNLTSDFADVILDNNGDLNQLRNRVFNLCQVLKS